MQLEFCVAGRYGTVGVRIRPETQQGCINQCKQITSPRCIVDIELVQIKLRGRLKANEHKTATCVDW
jgi:hypothetical protein